MPAFSPRSFWVTAATLRSASLNSMRSTSRAESPRQPHSPSLPFDNMQIGEWRSSRSRAEPEHGKHVATPCDITSAACPFSAKQHVLPNLAKAKEPQSQRSVGAVFLQSFTADAALQGWQPGSLVTKTVQIQFPGFELIHNLSVFSLRAPPKQRCGKAALPDATLATMFGDMNSHRLYEQLQDLEPTALRRCPVPSY